MKPRNWTWYQAFDWEDAPAPHSGGSNYLIDSTSNVAVAIRQAFGFHRIAQDWGEAAWTAKDLR